MRRLSVRRSHETGTLGSLLAGLSLGFVAGFLLRGVTGGVDRQRLETLRHEITGTYPTGRPGVRVAVATVRAALAREAALRDIEFEVVPVRAGHVELHGWVPTRAARARAMRVALAAAPGLEVTNRLTVLGEDDLEITPAPDARQPA